MSRLRVHFLAPPDDAARTALDRDLHGEVVTSTGAEVPADAEVIVGGRPSAEQLDAPDDLHALVIPYAGVPGKTRDLLLSRHPDTAVFNLHHNAPDTAETALALLLAAAKDVVPMDRDMREGDWRPRYTGKTRCRPIAGRTAVVLGLGAIGLRLARALAALDVHVVGVRRNPEGDEPDGVEEVRGPAAVPDVLERAGILAICLPLTDETRGLLDADAIARLPGDCILVNVGRGPIVDEDALFEALEAGRIAAAGLDVWWNYPETEDDRSRTPPGDRPWHTLDNVVLSPHRAGHAADTEERRMAALARLLNAIAHRRADSSAPAPPGRVDLRRGY